VRYDDSWEAAIAAFKRESVVAESWEAKKPLPPDIF
jgi:hypothetical protein